METAVLAEKKGITGSTLKIIAIVAMLIDHVGAVILEAYIKNAAQMMDGSQQMMMNYYKVYLVDLVLRCIGRFGFPIFVFLLIEGFTHTHSIAKYIRNLSIFVLLSEIPFNLALNHTLLSFEYQSVFCTLLIGTLVLTGIKYLAEDKKYSEKLAPVYYLAGIWFGALFGYLISYSDIAGFYAGLGLQIAVYWYIAVFAVVGLIVVCIRGRKLTVDQKNTFVIASLIVIVGVIAANLLNTDYSGWGIFTIVVMYYFRNDYKKRMIFGVLSLTLMSFLEAFAFFMVIPAKRYNGKRGLSIKYFFYAFYPVHLFILYLIAYFLGFAGFGIR